MSEATTTVNVRYRVGLLGKLAIFATFVLARVGVTVPIRFVVWAVNRSSYVAVAGGRWRRFNPELHAEQF